MMLLSPASVVSWTSPPPSTNRRSVSLSSVSFRSFLFFFMLCSSSRALRAHLRKRRAGVTSGKGWPERQPRALGHVAREIAAGPAQRGGARVAAGQRGRKIELAERRATVGTAPAARTVGPGHADCPRVAARDVHEPVLRVAIARPMGLD